MTSLEPPATSSANLATARHLLPLVFWEYNRWQGRDGAASGSVVAFDYFSLDIIEARSLYMRYSKAALNAVGEPLRFGIESTPPVRKHVAAFLESCGLSMEEQRNFGEETDRKHAMEGFATAIVSVR